MSFLSSPIMSVFNLIKIALSVKGQYTDNWGFGESAIRARVNPLNGSYISNDGETVEMLSNLVNSASRSLNRYSVNRDGSVRLGFEFNPIDYYINLEGYLSLIKPYVKYTSYIDLDLRMLLTVLSITTALLKGAVESLEPKDVQIDGYLNDLIKQNLDKVNSSIEEVSRTNNRIEHELFNIYDIGSNLNNQIRITDIELMSNVVRYSGTSPLNGSLILGGFNRSVPGNFNFLINRITGFMREQQNNMVRLEDRISSAKKLSKDLNTVCSENHLSSNRVNSLLKVVNRNYYRRGMEQSLNKFNEDVQVLLRDKYLNKRSLGYDLECLLDIYRKASNITSLDSIEGSGDVYNHFCDLRTSFSSYNRGFKLGIADLGNSYQMDNISKAGLVDSYFNGSLNEFKSYFNDLDGSNIGGVSNRISSGIDVTMVD